MIQSLRLRLAVWHGVVTGAVVVIVCGYSYAVHARAHYDQADMTLHDVARHVADELSTSQTVADQREVLAAARMLETQLWVFTRDGGLALGSGGGAPPVNSEAIGRPPRASFGLLPSLAPSLHAGHVADGRYDLVRGAGGQRWRVLAYPLNDGRTLVASTSLGPIDLSVHAFARLMAIMALAGSGLSFGIAWLLASRALRPVAAMREFADAISRSRELSKRIPTPDTTDELARLASTFNTMLASLEEASAAQQRFVTDASHELRAPLTAIQANLDLLQRAPDLPAADRKRAVDEAYGEATRMARLVGDLLALARADAGIPLQHTGFELDRVLIDVVREARSLSGGQAVHLTDIEPVFIHGDSDHIKQLLLILLDNAIRYTPQTGHVNVSLRRKGEVALIAVQDDGVGIATEALPHVFERFYRGDRARARVPGGTGLGLAIARWITEQHGGALELDSALGRGTTASVRLPISRAGSKS